MKNTTRKVICLIMAICIFSAMSTALARSSQTLSAYCAGCVAESGGEIAVWVDVTGKYPRMEKIGTDTIYLYESTDNKTFYCVKIFEADDYPSMMTTNAISYYKTAVTYQGIAGRYYSACVYCYAEKNGVSDSKPYETVSVQAIS
mgnify:CR=1 FL=1